MIDDLKHTKGPWKYTTSKSGRHQISDANGGQVCMLWIRQSDTTLANGRLIAAAPEMFMKLLHIYDAHEHINSVQDDLKKLIEAASGMNIQDVMRIVKQTTPK